MRGKKKIENETKTSTVIGTRLSNSISIIVFPSWPFVAHYSALYYLIIIKTYFKWGDHCSSTHFIVDYRGNHCSPHTFYCGLQGGNHCSPHIFYCGLGGITVPHTYFTVDYNSNPQWFFPTIYFFLFFSIYFFKITFFLTFLIFLFFHLFFLLFFSKLFLLILLFKYWPS
jgi:hypothetical protein